MRTAGADAEAHLKVDQLRKELETFQKDLQELTALGRWGLLAWGALTLWLLGPRYEQALHIDMWEGSLWYLLNIQDSANPVTVAAGIFDIVVAGLLLVATAPLTVGRALPPDSMDPQDVYSSWLRDRCHTISRAVGLKRRAAALALFALPVITVATLYGETPSPSLSRDVIGYLLIITSMGSALLFVVTNVSVTDRLDILHVLVRSNVKSVPNARNRRFRR